MKIHKIILCYIWVSSMMGYPKMYVKSKVPGMIKNWAMTNKKTATSIIAFNGLLIADAFTGSRGRKKLTQLIVGKKTDPIKPEAKQKDAAESSSSSSSNSSTSNNNPQRG